MAIFKYTATNKEGATYEGTIEAPDRFSVYSQVRKEGSTIVSVGEQRGHFSLGSLDAVNALLSRVKIADLILLTRNLSAMLSAGLSVSRSVEVMGRQSKNPKLKKVLGEIGETIKKGKSFHEALAEHPKVFSALFIAMTKAGEESGKLADAFTVIGHQMDRAYTLRRKIRGAMMYPSIIIVAMIGIGVLMLMFVVPTLTDTFEDIGAELPTSTKVIIGISNVLLNYPLLIFGCLIVMVVLLVMWFRTKEGKRMGDFILLHLPLISPLVRQTNAARTTRTLSSLLSSGVEVMTALSITREVMQNSFYKEVLSEAETYIQKGEPISKAFLGHAELYPAMVGEMIAVGEETGKLSDMMQDVAKFFEDEVEQKTKDLSTVIEPILMVVIGSAVGFFALSMISPIYSISSNI